MAKFLQNVFIFILSFAFFTLPTNIFADEGWVINDFHSEININKDGTIDVTETLKVDFNTLEKHGIFRELPYVYQSSTSEKLYTEVKFNEIYQDGEKAKVKITKNDNNLEARIGDPDKTISGKHIYIINFSVNGALSSFESQDELYWNVTGNNWDVAISSASSTVKTFGNNITQITCYEGELYSRDNCASNTNSASASFSTTRPLQSFEGLTIVAGLKKGVYPINKIERPKTFFEKLITPSSLITFAITTIAGIFLIFWLWFKHGRDYWTRGISGMMGSDKHEVKPIGAHEPVIVEFTPPENLPPAIIGVIQDERADTLDVTSTIIDLAHRGFLTITEVPKKWIFGSTDYVLKKLNKDTAKLYSYEKELLVRLFEKDEGLPAGRQVKLSDLKKTFYDDLAKVKEKLYQDVVNGKYFEQAPEKVRGTYLFAAVALMFLGFFGIGFGFGNSIVLFVDLGLAAIIIGIFVLIFARLMPRRTAKGREIYRRIKGYKMFIERAESYKQKFFEKRNMFSQALPYVIVFGLTLKFAQAMKDIGLKPQNPTWYSSAHAFNASTFSSDVSNFSSSLSTAIASSPSGSGFSSGGGFSGGGGGGGGGGSW